MAGTSEVLVRREREELFARLVHAYLERDFVAIERSLRPDVVLHLPGFSPFAGEHHGHEAVARLLVGLRQFLESEESPISYAHVGQDMVASQKALVHGPKHVVEMLVKVTMRFDEDDRVAAVYAQPSDVGLFDHVIGAALLDGTIEP